MQKMITEYRQTIQELTIRIEALQRQLGTARARSRERDRLDKRICGLIIMRGEMICSMEEMMDRAG